MIMYLIIYITLVVFIVSSYNNLKIFSLYLFILGNLIVSSMFIFYNKSIFWYGFIIELYRLKNINISYVIGIDILSLSLVLISVFLLFICLLFFWFLKYKIRFYLLLLFFTMILLINVFTSLDFFYFFIFFESIVIPMFFLIGVWGSRTRKIYAAYQLFIYTLLGSIFILICILDIILNKGSTSFDLFLNSNFFIQRELFFWIFLFIGFSVKIPIIPFHVWLPEAHVEAPTTGSVILAGIILKLGSYAMFRFLLMSLVCYDFVFIILIVALYGLTYASLVAFNQIDIKKIIAYSSIAHMNFSLLGLFSQSFEGALGCFLLMLGHALISSALFLGIGVLYDRYKTRLIFYYSSMAIFMPIFSIIYFIYILSNFGFPGTFNFVGEFLIILGGFNFSNITIFLSTFSMILCLFYSLFFYNRVFFGPIKKNFIRYYSDLNRLEFYILLILLILIIFFGIYPQLIVDFTYNYIYKITYIYI